jgi:hypothetical protein
MPAGHGALGNPTYHVLRCTAQDAPFIVGYACGNRANQS